MIRLFESGVVQRGAVALISILLLLTIVLRLLPAHGITSAEPASSQLEDRRALEQELLDSLS